MVKQTCTDGLTEELVHNNNYNIFLQTISVFNIDIIIYVLRYVLMKNIKITTKGGFVTFAVHLLACDVGYTESSQPMAT